VKRLTFVASVLALSAAAPSVAQADSWRVTGGLDYTSGMYGEARETQVLAVPMSAKYINGALTFRAAVPYLYVDGPANIAVLDDGEIGGGDVIGLPGAGRQSRSGFGDTTLSATYAFNRLGGTRAYLDVTGKLRLPTGDREAGLGTGATDVIAEAELGHAFRWGGAYVAVGRRFLGDSEVRVREDGWQLNSGAWISQGENELGGYVSWKQASVRTFDDPAELGAYVARRITPHWRMQISAMTGLSDASPDFGTAISFTYRSDARRRTKRND
jgi:hypothetical protein